MKKITFLFFLSLSFCAMAQEEARLLRFPASNGSEIVFTYAGDLYQVGISGGLARKLTSHIGFEMFPHYSPDGKTIAFTAQYDGNTEVYKIPSTGGNPQRLTYTATLGRDDVGDRMGPNNIVMTWTPDGKNIIYRSRKQSFNAFKGELFSVPTSGGMSSELPLATGGFCSYSPDGKKLAFNRVFREFRTWKYYKGGMADDVWVYDIASGNIENITNNNAQDIFPMWSGDEIYFLSDRDRIMNLFVYNTVTKTTSKVTNFETYDIKFPSIYGQTIVFENGGYIYKFDCVTKKSEKVNIQIADDLQYARREWKDASKRINSADISPNGERLLFAARGDIFTVPYKSGITRNLTHTTGIHERNAVWSPDGKYIAYVSDVSGEFEIYIEKQDGSEAPVQLTTGADTYKFEIEWSPDGKKIIWSDRMMRLQYVDVETKKVNLIKKSNYSVIRDFSWSPDSRWVAYSEDTSNTFNVIRLFNLETKKTYDATDNWYNSTAPAFSSDGKYLLFASARDFNPIYSDIEWNHAYVDMERVYLLLLSKNTASPFAPENNEVDINAGTTPKTDDKKTTPASDNKTVVIDLDGLTQRVVGFPIKSSNYYNLYCIENKIYYIENSSLGASSTAKVFDLKKKEEKELGSNVSFRISANNKKMLVRMDNRWGVIDLPEGKISLNETADLSNMQVFVDYEKEWKQIFDEAWRQMRDFFYAPNMHGVDWKAMHDKYAVLVPYVKQRSDLTYIIGEMIGELSVGHAYISSGEKPEPMKLNTGLLGAKLSKHSSGFFRIDKILEGANWSPSLKSPLTEPGLNINEGDYILAVNGQALNNIADIYSTLNGTAGKQVELLVNSNPSLSGSRKIIVIPIADEADLYYFNWVHSNIKKVEAATNGQVGYIHIPDMGVEGLNEFAKYFYPQLSCKALIIDDRGNGGGNVSPMIIERLQRQLTRSTMFRNRLFGRSVPNQMMLGPKVLLIDNYSASDGDLFPYAFKKHKLGKVIGMRSWGGVVGISGSLPFIDGTDLRKPEFASYSADESQWIIEGHGVDPDIVIDNDPLREYNGIDDQLNKAIDVILDELKNYKGLPDIPAFPDKSK